MKKILTLLALLAVSVPAFAQMGSFDEFAVPTRIQLAQPTLLNASAATFTNGPIDTIGFQGNALVSITSFTNAGGALTATLETSPDQTNWTSLANYAVSVAVSRSITNHIYGGTGLSVTQTFFLPGTPTTPTASSYGSATPYLVPSLFTNTGPLTITTKGQYFIGYKVADANRYLHVIWTPTGSSSNDTVSATFSGYQSQPQY